MGELGAHARLGIFRQRYLPAEHSQDWRFAPVEAVAEVQIERPVAIELRPRFRFDRRTGFSITMDAGRETVRTLAFECAMDRHRTINPIAAAIERHRSGALDITPDVAIGIDPEHQHAPVHAID